MLRWCQLVTHAAKQQINREDIQYIIWDRLILGLCYSRRVYAVYVIENGSSLYRLQWRN